MTRILVYCDKQFPTMKTLSLSDVKARLSGLVDEVERRDGEIVITRNGQPAAVLVSPDEYESWKETLAVRSDKALMREIKAGLAAIKSRKTRRYTLEKLFE
jgi:antitoxin YefM